MLGFGTLRSAVIRLANALASLAQTCEEANANARRNLTLDTPDADDLPMLPGPEPEAVAAVGAGNGRRGKRA